MNDVILGLGSNIGDRLENLRAAFSRIKHISGVQVKQHSPLYISDALLPDNAPASWDQPHINFALVCTTSLSPIDLLAELKKIETALGRPTEKQRWSPRLIDIDILAYGEETIKTDVLTIPHPGLTERPFALWPLADLMPFWMHPVLEKTAAELVEVWGSRFDAAAPLHTRQLNQRLEGSRLMGIINITPDSFSDGGLYLQTDTAVQHALELMEAGAEILDLGAESTAPTAEALDAETEWQRLEPILSVIKSAQFLIPPKISIDTRHPETAMRALAMGIDWINDVSGLDHPDMRELVAASGKDCVVMHHLNIPQRAAVALPRDQNAVDIVYRWGEERISQLEKTGIKREKIIFDPGIGFGKFAEQSLALIQQSHIFKQLGVRLLIGHSRKRFLSLLTGNTLQERDIETMMLSVFLDKQGIDYLRVHNVKINSQGLRNTSHRMK
ncbi:MAG: dihydropteroate synthase [Gammaproteobacteria bacterium]